MLTIFFLDVNNPSIVIPLDAKTFEADCTTMSAPNCNGRVNAGEAQVASTISGTLFACAKSATVFISKISTDGLDGNSP